MILLWFIFGIALIFAIARYNESNKLFWMLTLAFVMGFALTKMVLQTNKSNEQSNVKLEKVYSTQMPATTLNALSYYITSVVKEDSAVTVQKSVGQSYMPSITKRDVILSEVFGRTRDQPLQMLKPPELCFVKDILTLHDTG